MTSRLRSAALLTSCAALGLYAAAAKADPPFDFHSGPCVFASPSSGLLGPVTCRRLAAADIPSSTPIINGTTPISAGTPGNILYDNSGTLGEKSVTGSGSVVLGTSPSIASPGVTGTLTGPDGGTWGSGGINGSAIGGTTPAAGTFTNLQNGAFSFNSNIFSIASGTTTAFSIGFSNSNGPTDQYWGTASGNTGSRIFVIGGAEKMRLDGSGRLLVGYPANQGGQLLQVNGATLFNGNATITGGSIALATTVANSAGYTLSVATGSNAPDFNGSGSAKAGVFAYNSANTSIVNDNGYVIRNENGTSGAVTGLHFSQGNGGTSGSNLYPIGASLIAISGTKTANQYTATDLTVLLSNAANQAPSEDFRFIHGGTLGIGSTVTNGFGVVNVGGFWSGAVTPLVAGAGFAVTGGHTGSGASYAVFDQDGTDTARIWSYGHNNLINGSIIAISQRSDGTGGRQVTLLDPSGNTALPGNLTLGPSATLATSSGNLIINAASADVVFNIASTEYGEINTVGMKLAGGLTVGGVGIATAVGPHLEFHGTAPGVTAGTGATVAGNDSAGRVVVGTSPSTTVALTFANSFTNAPSCFAQDETTAITMRATTISTSGVTFTASGTLTASDKVSYLCMTYS